MSVVTEDELRERVVADGVNWWDFVRTDEYAAWAAENLTAAVDFTDGWMVALYPTEEQAEEIARDGGQDAEHLHVTLAFFPEPVDAYEVVQALEEAAVRAAPMTGTLVSLAEFPKGDDGVPVIAIPSVLGLNELRADVVRALDARGVGYAKNFGYVPHMTLAYVERRAPKAFREVVGQEVSFDRLCFVMGEQKIELPLGGPLTAAYVETLHPRHPAGSGRGGEWRAKGPTVNEAHVETSIEKWVQDTAAWRAGRGEAVTPEEVASDRQFLFGRYHEVYDAPLALLEDRLAGFTDVTIQPDIADQAGMLMDPESESLAVFNVALPRNSTGSKPDVSVWVTARDGLRIEDVLDVTDQDFFDSTGSSLRYANMLDAIRGIKRTGTVQLYRGMSGAERSSWDGGAEIPTGKFFTSRPTAAMAADVPGEFPELHVFEVAAEDVIETDPGVYQTVRPTIRRADGVLRAAATVVAMTAGYVESQHPRDPGGEGGGRWIPKGTTAADETPKAGPPDPPKLQKIAVGWYASPDGKWGVVGDDPGEIQTKAATDDERGGVAVGLNTQREWQVLYDKDGRLHEESSVGRNLMWVDTLREARAQLPRLVREQWERDQKQLTAAGGHDESKHPRVPAGTANRQRDEREGGQFAPKEGASGGGGDLEERIAEIRKADPTAAVTEIGSTQLDFFDFEEGVWDPERAMLHREWEVALLVDGQPSENPTALFLAGGSGTGKTGIKNLEGLDPDHSVQVNPDEIKEMIPEYVAMNAAAPGAGDPLAAPYVHEESSHVAKQVAKQAILMRSNMTIDGTGDSGAPGNFMGKIRAAQEAGYAVEVVLVDADTDVALQRAQQRFERTGRSVDPDVLRTIHENVAYQYEDWSGKVDNWRVYANDGAVGEHELIAYREGGGDIVVLDEARLKKFRDKAKGKK